LNRDPLGEVGGLNLYGFVGNDPVNWVDPDGRLFRELFRDLGTVLTDWMMGGEPLRADPYSYVGQRTALLGPTENTLTTAIQEGVALTGDLATDQLAGMAAGRVLGAGMTCARRLWPGAGAGKVPAWVRAGTEQLHRLDEAANRALRLPATDTTLAGTRTLGYTTPSGNVFLQPGLSRAEQLSTLRHESVHAFFSPRGNGSVATFRQNLGQWGYDNSQLLRFTEEAIAETYGSGSLLQGLRHPFVNGYGITPGGLLLEGGVVGGGIFGAGYLGSQGGH
jgi:hypothetical protein